MAQYRQDLDLLNIRNKGLIPSRKDFQEKNDDTGKSTESERDIYYKQKNG